MRTMSLLAAALLVGAAAGAPTIARAIESGSPAAPQTTTQQPPSNTGTKKAHSKKAKKSSATDDFYKGWHTAYALIYDKADYADGIAVLRSKGYDDNADVATLIGYASRKLGRYDDAKIWYDRALAADPNHALTWSYYGMWQAEQGNILKAKDDLEKVKNICGTECRSYTALKAAIDGTATY
ncbi:MAG: tetratricopeptide repeat protein [Xanthobacteraceae bacterium]